MQAGRQWFTAALAALSLSGIAQASDLKVTFTNLTPAGGVGVAPLWVGFHNSSFDAFDLGTAASLGIERAAEDGNPTQLGSIFAATAAGGVQGVLPGGPAFSGDTRTLTFSGLDLAGANRYFSYAAMVVLSNDFFTGNDNAEQFDLSSLLPGSKLSIYLSAGNVYDAGTEVNDFHDSAANGKYGIGGGQKGPNQGADEHGVVHQLTGNPYASFLGQDLVPEGHDWGALNFNGSTANFARIDIEVAAVPEPESYALMLAGLSAVAWVARRRADRKAARA